MSLQSASCSKLDAFKRTSLYAYPIRQTQSKVTSKVTSNYSGKFYGEGEAQIALNWLIRSVPSRRLKEFYDDFNGLQQTKIPFIAERYQAKINAYLQTNGTEIVHSSKQLSDYHLRHCYYVTASQHKKICISEFISSDVQLPPLPKPKIIVRAPLPQHNKVAFRLKLAPLPDRKKAVSYNPKRFPASTATKPESKSRRTMIPYSVKPTELPPRSIFYS